MCSNIPYKQGIGRERGPAAIGLHINRPNLNAIEKRYIKAPKSILHKRHAFHGRRAAISSEVNTTIVDYANPPRWSDKPRCPTCIPSVRSFRPSLQVLLLLPAAPLIEKLSLK